MLPRGHLGLSVPIKKNVRDVGVPDFSIGESISILMELICGLGLTHKRLHEVNKNKTYISYTSPCKRKRFS